MENREAFTGISAEVKDNIEEVKQRNFNQRGSSNYRGNNRGSYNQTSYNSRGRSYSYNNGYSKTGQHTGTSYHT